MSAARAGKGAAIAGVAELLAHAHLIEVEAAERYHMLADQMEVHNNAELATLFRKLAGHEEHHAREILEQAGDMELPELKLDEIKWPGAEGPETADFGEAHYLMTPWHALMIALEAERRAHRFFDELCQTVDDAEMRKWAEEFREEEAGHVRMVEELLARYPEPAAGWAEDDDPPANQE